MRIQCATGAHTIEQSALAASARRRLERAPREVQQVIPLIYEHSAIQARHFEIEPSESEGRANWLAVLNQATRSLAERTVQGLIDTAPPAALIVVSSTHSGFPSLSRRLQNRFGLAPETLCFDLAGTGCVGAPHALYLADVLLRSRQAASACVLCVDALGTLSQVGTWSDDQSLSQVVAHCLASDGAAAVLLRSHPRESEPTDALTYSSCKLSTRLWADSLDWNVFGADSANQPYFAVSKEIRTRLASEVEKILDEETANAPIVAHPGGVALMQAMLKGMPHLKDYLQLCLEELGSHGNFGSPSVLRVLKLALERGVRLTPAFSLLAFGPGKVTALLRYDGVKTKAE